MEVIPSRELNSLFIYIDLVFLAVLAAALLWRKKYPALLFGLFGGVLYFIVDYGIFYAALGTRTVTGAPVGPFLLWLSMSYGFTNFVWIWLWLDRDRDLLEWSLFIPIGWLAEGMLSQNFGSGFTQISISRGTTSYHGVMALILAVGYGILFFHNLRAKDKGDKYPILYILAIGILVQFAWEAALLLCGIRATGWAPLVVNSLIETNLGLPYIFLIHRAVTGRLARRKKAPLSVDETDSPSQLT